MKMRRVITLALLLLGLAGCSLPGAREQAIRYFVLDTPLPEAVAESGEAERPVLLLRDAEASVFTQIRVWSTAASRARGPITSTRSGPNRRPSGCRRCCANACWPAGLYAGVVPLGAGVRGDFS
jgi:hypothetical protein